jgi:GAF domain-containing protein/HAMP domain-containing protein
VNISTITQTIQFVAWFVALIEIILGLYILVLNAWHSANRHLAALLLLFSINSYALGNLTAATSVSDAYWPAFFVAVSAPAIPSLLVLNTIILIKPEWRSGNKKLLWGIFYAIALAPIFLAGSDIIIHTKLWFSGLETSTYSGGFAAMPSYTQGALGVYVRFADIYLPYLIIGLILIYASFLDKKLFPVPRRLARLLLAALSIALGLQFGMIQVIHGAVVLLGLNIIYLFTYSYAGFRQMISERRLQRGNLQFRLTALILVVVIPVLLAMMIFITSNAETLLKNDANENLRATNKSLSTAVSLWLDFNVGALQDLVSQPGIISMDAQEQEPILRSMARAYPHMYLISTTDLYGTNIARSDDAAPKDYGDREWYLKSRNGAPITFQTLIGRTSGEPALVVSMPIKDENGNIVGVGMFASDLDIISQQIRASLENTNGYSFVIDDQNRVIAHPDELFTSQLFDMGEYRPVKTLRSTLENDLEYAGSLENEALLQPFSDDQGELWRSYGKVLDNNWAVITQVPEHDLLAPARFFQRISWYVFVFGVGLLLIMAWFTIWQGLQPIRSLTETATAIASGDLTRLAPVTTQDELGLLARTFNSMTNQLRDLITTLERRVIDRTRELEHRALQLQVTADVAREAASIRNLDRLLTHTVQLVSDRFNFYHVGIFLIDEAHKFAILKEGSSIGGRRMLERGHKLRIGEEGIVGYAAEQGKPRIALDVGTDAVYFNNPDLPKTRSEMALPLIVRDRVIGVLDVQSTKASAFSSEDIEILQILADQVALAIDNARLLTESRQSVRELENLYGKQTRQAWDERLSQYRIAYYYDRIGVKRASSGSPPVTSIREDGYHLQVSLKLGGQHIGMLHLRRDEDQEPWSETEITLVESAVSQVSRALENARLIEENRVKARNEKIIGEIAAVAQSSLDVETIMRRTVHEIGQAVRASRVQIKITGGQHKNDGHKNNGGRDV